MASGAGDSERWCGCGVMLAEDWEVRGGVVGRAAKVEWCERGKEKMPIVHRVLLWVALWDMRN